MESKLAYRILRLLEGLEYSDIKKIRLDKGNEKFINSLIKSLSDSDQKKLINEFSCDCDNCLKINMKGDKDVEGME